MRQWIRERRSHGPGSVLSIAPRRWAASRVCSICSSIFFPQRSCCWIALGMVTGYLEKWLWMGDLHYSGIFWTLFSFSGRCLQLPSPSSLASSTSNLHEALGHSGALVPLVSRKKNSIAATRMAMNGWRANLSPILLRVRRGRSSRGALLISTALGVGPGPRTHFFFSKAPQFWGDFLKKKKKG